MKGSPPFLFPIFLLLITSLPKSTFPFIQSGSEIFDLQETDPSLFEAEALLWTLSPDDPSSIFSRTYTCGTIPILGGVNFSPSEVQTGKYYKRLYTSLPSHSSVIYTIQFYLLDSWDLGDLDGFKLELDSTLIATWSYSLSLFTSPLCGTTTTDGILQLYGYIPHTTPSLTLKITLKFNEFSPNESLGVRNVHIAFSNAAINSPSLCQRADFTFTTPTPCPCQEDEYQDLSSGSCISCDHTCKSCFNSGPASCFLCAEGYFFDGDTCTACDSSCLTCSGPSSSQCTSCQIDYLIWNGECLHCPADNLLFQGNCISNDRCTTPFEIINLNSSSLTCSSPCEETSLATWQYSCFPPCSSNNTIFDLTTECKICESLTAEYLQPSQIGHLYQLTLFPSSCDFDEATMNRFLLLSEQVAGSVQPFTFQISKTDQNTYLLNLILHKTIFKTKTLNVRLDYLKTQLLVPRKFEPSSFTVSLQGAVSPIKIAIAVITGISWIGNLALGSTANFWSFLNFQQFVGYLLYVNIAYPSQLQTFLSMIGFFIWGYLPNPLHLMTKSSMEELLTCTMSFDRSLMPPEKFILNEISSFFMENGGLLILINLFLLFLLTFVLCVKKAFQNKILLRTIKVALRWNVIARTFLQTAIPLSLATCLQFRISNFTGSYLALNMIFTLISGVYMLGMLAFLFRILLKRSISLLAKGLIKRMFGALYDGVTLKTGVCKFYYMAILFRGLLLVIFISYFEAYPLLQIIPLIFYNFGLLVYLKKEIAFDDSKLSLIMKIKELLILLAEVGILCLCLQIENANYFEGLGWIIVVLLLTAFLLDFGYMVGMQILRLPEIGACLSKKCGEFWEYLKGNGEIPNETKFGKVRLPRKKLEQASVAHMNP